MEAARRPLEDHINAHGEENREVAAPSDRPSSTESPSETPEDMPFVHGS